MNTELWCVGEIPKAASALTGHALLYEDGLQDPSILQAIHHGMSPTTGSPGGARSALNKRPILGKAAEMAL